MIGSLKGVIVGYIGKQLLIETNDGIGYLVHVNNEVSYISGSEIKLYIFHVVREDANELYGFADLEAREWVTKLLQVDGVGPKAASMIMHSLGVESLRNSILHEDFKTICAVKGIGAKTAKKIVLELKGAATDLSNLSDSSEGKGGAGEGEFRAALTNMGYRKQEIDAIITRLKTNKEWDPTQLAVMIRLALR
jgi:holliday junction DNA helicase RuvA